MVLDTSIMGLKKAFPPLNNCMLTCGHHISITTVRCWMTVSTVKIQKLARLHQIGPWASTVKYHSVTNPGSVQC